MRFCGWRAAIVAASIRGADRAWRFKALEDENRRLREILTGICADRGVSIRKACGAICFGTSSYHDKSRRTDQAAFRTTDQRICEIRVRYGDGSCFRTGVEDRIFISLAGLSTRLTSPLSEF